MIKYIVWDEVSITKSMHKELQRLLQRAYSYRTNLFQNKSYGYCRPIKRIIAVEKDNPSVIIGHTAIFDVKLIQSHAIIKIAGVGMTFNLRPLLLIGNELRKRAVILSETLRYPAIIGRVRNNARTKASLEGFTHGFLNILLKGNHTQSHMGLEVLAIYSTKEKTLFIENLISQCDKEGYVLIEGEVF